MFTRKLFISLLFVAEVGYGEDADQHFFDYSLEELEQMLNETKQDLLDKKLLLADKEQEIHSLKRQVEKLQKAFQSLEVEKVELDKIVMRL